MNRLTSLIAWLRPRHAGALLGLLVLGFALYGAFDEELPVGSMEGQVVLKENGKPLAGVRVYLFDGYRETYRARSDKNGRFRFSRLPAGGYRASASTDAHKVVESALTVMEGESENVTLTLERSQPEIEIKQHQRVFTSTEGAHLSLSGYVDPKKPPRSDSVRLRLFRTRLSNLLAKPEQMQSLRGVSWRDETMQKPVPREFFVASGTPIPALLEERNVPITQDDQEGFYYQTLTLGKLKHGVYLLDVAHSGKANWTWLMVTDTALVVKRVQGQTLFYAADMKRGSPLPNVAVSAYRKGGVIGGGKTDKNGVLFAKLSLPLAGESEAEAQDGSPEARQIVYVAKNGDDEALAQQGFYNEALGEYSVHLYTDRPIYRPGQHISFKGIARKRKPETLDALKPLSANTVLRPYTVPIGEAVSLEVRTPKGEKVFEQKLTTNNHGAFFGGFSLDADAPTGVYTTTMEQGGETFTHDIVIASYEKPEYTVTVTPSKPRYTPDEQVEMTISGQYFFGSPVAGAKIKYYIYTEPDWASEFPDEYEYDSATDSSPSYMRWNGYDYGETQHDGEATLDESGKAVIRFPAKAKLSEGSQTEGPQGHSFNVEVTLQLSEEKSVNAAGKARVVAGEFWLGVSPEGYAGMPNKPTNVTLFARDHDGKPVANQAVTLEGYYQSWKAGTEENQYRETLQKTPLGTPQQVTTGADGRIIVPITPTKTGDLVLQATAKDAKGRTILGRANLWVADDRGGDMGLEYTDLSLMTDKRRYQPGETARVLINAATTGQYALLTVEGERIYRAEVVPLTQRTTTKRIPILTEYGPNVTLKVCYVRNKKYAQSETPLRILLPERGLKVSITPDHTPPKPDALPRYQPGETALYTVQTTDTKGKPVAAEFSLGVVDEAIYALREDDPAAIRDTFYPRTYNRVETIFSFAVEYLGDADKAEPLMTTRKNFPDTAFWKADLQTDAQGRAQVRVPLADNLTTWRTTVIAHTPETLVGRGTCKIISSKPFMVRVEKPRFLTQYDTSQITAILHNETDAPQTALVRLKAQGLKVEGEDTQHFTLAAGQRETATWNVTAEQSGTANLRVTAWTTDTGKQFTDGVETTLGVKPHGREKFTMFAGELTAAKPEYEVLRLEPNAAPNSVSLQVRLTPSLAHALLGSTEYLLDYPYGCVEQTTSRLLADILAQQLLRQNAGLTFARANEIPSMAKSGLRRLADLQNTESGTWGWWSHDKEDGWMTAYALMGMAMAKSAGYAPREDVWAQGRAGALKMAKAHNLDAPALKSTGTLGTLVSPKTYGSETPFLLYALALSGYRKELAPIRKKLNLNLLSVQDLAYVALSDRLCGVANSPALALLNRRAISKRGMVWWQHTPKEGVDYYGIHESDISATATAMQALLAANPNDPRLLPIIRWIMQARTAEYWVCTRDTAAILMAFRDYLTAHPASGSSGQIAVRVNGKIVQTIALTPQTLREPESVVRVPASALRPDKNDLALERIGGDSLAFYSVQLRQTVVTNDLEPLSPQGFRIVREYLRVVPKRNKNGSLSLITEPAGNVLQAGDNIRVRLTIYATQKLNHVLIEDPYPSGCNISERGSREEVMEWGYWWSSVDVRDDKIALFAQEIPKGKSELEYNLRAQTPGTYRVLPTFLQPMYAPELRVEGAGDRLEIR